VVSCVVVPQPMAKSATTAAADFSILVQYIMNYASMASNENMHGERGLGKKLCNIISTV